MPLYRTRPVVLEARRFTGEPSADLEVWIGEAFESWLPSRRQLAIRTLAGEQIVSAGDYVIRGVDGAFSGCRPDLFEATHEPAEPERA